MDSAGSGSGVEEEEEEEEEEGGDGWRVKREYALANPMICAFIESSTFDRVEEKIGMMLRGRSKEGSDVIWGSLI